LGVASCAIENFDEKTKEEHSPMIEFWWIIHVIKMPSTPTLLLSSTNL
jgi:hypothetical protein